MTKNDSDSAKSPKTPRKPRAKLPKPFSAEELAPMPIPTERLLEAGTKRDSEPTAFPTVAPDRRDTTGNPGTPWDTLGRIRDTKTEPTQTQKLTGDVPLSGAEAGSLYGARSLESLPLARARRGETKSQCWERLRREGRAAGMTRRGAISYAGGVIDSLFPPPEPAEPEPSPEDEPPQPEPIALDLSPIGDELEDEDEIPQSDDGVPGLGELPESWGTLPSNASLQAEISWVSANRLRVRSGTGVDLSRALSPAPSYSALSWLETSILFPSKFADISVKATAQQDDEREGIRREKLAIEEIRGLLAEMLEG